MSFSKAKLQRFNEVHSCAPPPGAYNPKEKKNLPGAVIPKSDRFITESPAGSDSASVTSGTNSSVFRTPTLNKKKTIIKASSTSSSKIPSTCLFLNNDDSEALKEKIVECMNKDETIMDLVVQIEELKDKISNLEVQQQQLNLENQEYEAKMYISKTKFDNALLQLQKENESELNNVFITNKELVDELVTIQNENDKYKMETDELINQLKEEHDKALKSEQDEISRKTEELQVLEERYNGSLIALSELQRSHSEEIEEMKNKHNLEVQDIEYEMLKCVTESQKLLDTNNAEIKRLKEEIEEKNNMLSELTQELLDTEARLKQAEENSMEMKKFAEIQTEERIKGIEADCVMKLKEQQDEFDKILKECQAIGEFNIIQCELEKNEIKQELKEAIEKITDLKTSERSAVKERDNIKNYLTKIENELLETKAKVDSIKQLYESMVEKFKNEKHTYEISLSKALETVEALKKRLINSDKDVEQLKKELENVEAAKLEFEGKCNNLIDQIANVTKFKDELLRKNAEIENYVTKAVSIAEKSLLEKIDQIQTAAKHIIAEKDDQLMTALSQLTVQQNMNYECQHLIKAVKSELGRLEEENAELKRSVAQIDVLRQEIDDNADINKKYVDQSGKLDSLQQELEEMKKRNKELEKTVSLQNALIGPYREQLEEYEAQRISLLNEKSEAETELRQLGLKYAESLGHQNTKQKIKHLVDLKQKNYDLQNSNKDLLAKVTAQSKAIDKLKKELSDKKNDKRNSKLINNTSIITNSDKENVSPLKQWNIH